MNLNKNFINYQLRLKFARRRIFFSCIVLSLLGILLVYDTSSIYAWFNYSDAMYFFKRQIFFLILGLILLAGVLRVDTSFLKKQARLLLVMGIIFLVLVLFIGVKIGGARRWLKVLGFGFQPSEFMKVLFLLYLADYFSRRNYLVKSFLKDILPLLGVTCLVCILIFLEPDLGTAIFFGLLTLVFLFIAHIPRKYLGVLFLIFSVVFLVLIFSSPYRRMRIFSYLNPWADPQGKGFQIVQSQIALGSGGFLGQGLGESKQKLFFLPAAYTDFIFSIAGEEFGFLGCVFLLGIYIFIFFQGLKILKWVNDKFNFYLGWGSLFILTFQALVNIAVVVGVFPTKGLPLPFISYGGSSLLSSFILLGLFLKATKEVIEE
ncbi:MAG: putative lipid II flippase FtsW [Candidatus Omnitrophica bacterium]|nr:putative lipid II flippase FtsW [Candidatus Omnitrophota bacterium]